MCNEAVFAQNTWDTAKTLKMRAYGSIVYPSYARHIEWMPDGEHYIQTEQNENGQEEIVSYSVKDESRKLLIPAEQLMTNKTSGEQLAVWDLVFSKDEEKALIFTNTRRVWRYNTRGDYWVLNRKSGELHQLGKGLPESSLMFAKFSPDGSKVAYVSKNNLYVEDLATKSYKAITTDGNDTIVNGTFDWVYE